MTTKAEAPAGDENERLRRDLVAALEREGIAYPPERLEEALEEYIQLKRLIAVVASANEASAQPKDRS